ncbi:MAG TPA: hypothetical protein VMZ50_12235, partial [Phycisphaerae bacterium]|nr:hypothetical protein [Phycisphaerae bacterium]
MDPRAADIVNAALAGVLAKAGTSEGAERGWETRRGRSAVRDEDGEGRKRTIEEESADAAEAGTPQDEPKRKKPKGVSEEGGAAIDVGDEASDAAGAIAGLDGPEARKKATEARRLAQSARQRAGKGKDEDAKALADRAREMVSEIVNEVVDEALREAVGAAKRDGPEAEAAANEAGRRAAQARSAAGHGDFAQAERSAQEARDFAGQASAAAEDSAEDAAEEGEEAAEDAAADANEEADEVATEPSVPATEPPEAAAEPAAEPPAGPRVQPGTTGAPAEPDPVTERDFPAPQPPTGSGKEGHGVSRSGRIWLHGQEIPEGVGNYVGPHGPLASRANQAVMDAGNVGGRAQQLAEGAQARAQRAFDLWDAGRDQEAAQAAAQVDAGALAEAEGLASAGIAERRMAEVQEALGPVLRTEARTDEERDAMARLRGHMQTAETARNAAEAAAQAGDWDRARDQGSAARDALVAAEDTALEVGGAEGITPDYAEDEGEDESDWETPGEPEPRTPHEDADLTEAHGLQFAGEAGEAANRARRSMEALSAQGLSSPRAEYYSQGAQEAADRAQQEAAAGNASAAKNYRLQARMFGAQAEREAAQSGLPASRPTGDTIIGALGAAESNAQQMEEALQAMAVADQGGDAGRAGQLERIVRELAGSPSMRTQSQIADRVEELVEMSKRVHGKGQGPFGHITALGSHMEGVRQKTKEINKIARQVQTTRNEMQAETKKKGKLDAAAMKMKVQAYRDAVRSFQGFWDKLMQRIEAEAVAEAKSLGEAGMGDVRSEAAAIVASGVEKYGTSSGSKKGWERRKRGLSTISTHPSYRSPSKQERHRKAVEEGKARTGPSANVGGAAKRAAAKAKRDAEKPETETEETPRTDEAGTPEEKGLALHLGLFALEKAGTSEGAARGWETRRGRAPAEPEEGEGRKPAAEDAKAKLARSGADVADRIDAYALSWQGPNPADQRDYERLVVDIGHMAGMTYEVKREAAGLFGEARRHFQYGENNAAARKFREGLAALEAAEGQGPDKQGPLNAEERATALLERFDEADLDDEKARESIDEGIGDLVDHLLDEGLLGPGKDPAAFTHLEAAHEALEADQRGRAREQLVAAYAVIDAMGGEKPEAAADPNAPSPEQQKEAGKIAPWLREKRKGLSDRMEALGLPDKQTKEIRGLLDSLEADAEMVARVAAGEKKPDRPLRGVEIQSSMAMKAAEKQIRKWEAEKGAAKPAAQAADVQALAVDESKYGDLYRRGRRRMGDERRRRSDDRNKHGHAEAKRRHVGRMERMAGAIQNWVKAAARSKAADDAGMNTASRIFADRARELHAAANAPAPQAPGGAAKWSAEWLAGQPIDAQLAQANTDDPDPNNWNHFGGVAESGSMPRPIGGRVVALGEEIEGAFDAAKGARNYGEQHARGAQRMEDEEGRRTADALKFGPDDAKRRGVRRMVNMANSITNWVKAAGRAQAAKDAGLRTAAALFAHRAALLYGQGKGAAEKSRISLDWLEKVEASMGPEDIGRRIVEKAIAKAGTSEGAERGWETRRGRAAAEPEAGEGRAPAGPEDEPGTPMREDAPESMSPKMAPDVEGLVSDAQGLLDGGFPGGYSWDDFLSDPVADPGYFLPAGEQRDWEEGRGDRVHEMAARLNEKADALRDAAGDHPAAGKYLNAAADAFREAEGLFGSMAGERGSYDPDTWHSAREAMETGLWRMEQGLEGLAGKTPSDEGGAPPTAEGGGKRREVPIGEPPTEKPRRVPGEAAPHRQAQTDARQGANGVKAGFAGFNHGDWERNAEMAHAGAKKLDGAVDQMFLHGILEGDEGRRLLNLVTDVEDVAVDMVNTVDRGMPEDEFVRLQERIEHEATDALQELSDGLQRAWEAEELRRAPEPKVGPDEVKAARGPYDAVIDDVATWEDVDSLNEAGHERMMEEVGGALDAFEDQVPQLVSDGILSEDDADEALEVIAEMRDGVEDADGRKVADAHARIQDVMEEAFSIAEKKAGGGARAEAPAEVPEGAEGAEEPGFDMGGAMGAVDAHFDSLADNMKRGGQWSEAVRTSDGGFDTWVADEAMYHESVESLRDAAKDVARIAGLFAGAPGAVGVKAGELAQLAETASRAFEDLKQAPPEGYGGGNPAWEDVQHGHEKLQEAETAA